MKADTARSAPGYTLLLLFGANALNVADRALLGIVVDPVKADLALSDTQMSLVSGAAFIVFNLLVGIYIARWADHGNRKLILLIGVALWSAATALTALAQGFWSLALTRVLVGVGEATCFPVAISMLADLYTGPRRPRAISIFQASVFVGIVAGSILAGVIAGAIGWRQMFAAWGLAGFALVALMWGTMREPARASEEGTLAATLSVEQLGPSLRFLLGRPGFLLLLLGAGVASMTSAVLPIWAPTFLLRSHGVSLESVGALIGPPVGLGGIGGTIFAGFAAGRLARRRGVEADALAIAAIALPLAAPLFAGMLLLPSLPMVVACIFLMNFLLASALPICINVAVGVARPRMRAVASTLILVSSGIIGSALAPAIVGSLSDALMPRLGAESLRYAMSTLAITPVLGGLLLWLAGRGIRHSEETALPLRT